MTNYTEQLVLDLAKEHRDTWRDRDDMFWFARLLQEVGELGSSLVKDHDDSPDWEMMQISAICLNWLDMRMMSGTADIHRKRDNNE